MQTRDSKPDKTPRRASVRRAIDASRASTTSFFFLLLLSKNTPKEKDTQYEDTTTEAKELDDQEEGRERKKQSAATKEFSSSRRCAREESVRPSQSVSRVSQEVFVQNNARFFCFAFLLLKIVEENPCKKRGVFEKDQTFIKREKSFL